MSAQDADTYERTNRRRPTLEERGVTVSERPKGKTKADLANVDQFPSMKAGISEWVERFDQRPDILHAILGDIFRTVRYKDEGRVDGRRGPLTNASLDELSAMITPRYSQEPFAVAIKELIGDRSLRQFAMKVPIDHRELSRLIRGERELTRYRLERIAAAGKVAPAFFCEWRTLYFTETLAAVFAQRPNLSIGVVRRMSQVSRW
jgi:hypothetical protein